VQQASAGVAAFCRAHPQPTHQPISPARASALLRAELVLAAYSSSRVATAHGAAAAHAAAVRAVRALTSAYPQCQLVAALEQVRKKIGG
jgi:hypothetical protein